MGVRNSRLASSGAIWLPVLLLAGCGQSDIPPLAHVSGKLTLDGQPLRMACITFFPVTAHRASTGITDDAGHFDLVYLRDIRGAVVGDHRVSIRMIPIEEGVATAHPLPPQYNVTTELIATVEHESNTIDFSLSSD